MRLLPESIGKCGKNFFADRIRHQMIVMSDFADVDKRKIGRIARRARCVEEKASKFFKEGERIQ
jgi:hypothetical protein